MGQAWVPTPEQMKAEARAAAAAAVAESQERRSLLRIMTGRNMNRSSTGSASARLPRMATGQGRWSLLGRGRIEVQDVIRDRCAVHPKGCDYSAQQRRASSEKKATP